jgi:hypothetical protein
MGSLNGIIRELSEAVYHADPALGSGSIKHLAESPAAFAASKLSEFEGSAATELGSAFHMKLLQPERYALEVVEMKEDLSFATKEGKEFKKRAIEKSADPESLLFLKPDRVRIIEQMSAAVESIEASLNCNPFLIDGHSELAHFWEEENGIRGKALVDRKLDRFRWLLDVKTTSQSLNERNLLRHAYDQGWALQAAWYTRGVRKLQPDWEESIFAFCVFQTTAPYSARVVTVPTETIERANLFIEKALENFLIYEKNMLENKRQPDPNSAPMDLIFPDWSFKIEV